MQNTSLYVARQSRLHALHPFSKGALALVFLVGAASLPNIVWLLAAYALLLPLALWGRVLPDLLRGNALAIWPFLLSLALIQGFFNPGTTVLFTVGPFAFSWEGLLSGLTFTARILLALGATYLFMLTTRPDKMMLALTQRGFPQALAYVLLTSLQIFPRFQERARVILEAQEARGLETGGNLLQRARMLLPLVGPLLLSSIVEVDERAVALEARAFNHPGEKTSLLTLEDSAGQAVLRAALLLGALALLAWRLWEWLGP